MAKYDPFQVRRCVRIAGAAPDGVVMFKSKSFTKTATDVTYHPAIDIQTGAVTCDCPHYTYRLAKHNPTIASGEACKHLARALANLTRRGLISD